MNNKGFTLVEVMIASSILLTVITTIAPLITIVKYERQKLHEQRIISSFLHDELQEFIWMKESVIPFTKVKSVQGKEIHLSFVMEGQLIKGCVTWKNVKSKHENICLYGKS